MTSASPSVPPIDPALQQDLRAFLNASDAGEAAFNALALRLFEHQFRHNLPLQRHARQQGRTPRTVRRWQDIPAVPVDAFKDLDLSCVPVQDCAAVFMTSGTTRADRRGRHYHPDLTIYDLSMRLNFAQRFMGARPQMAMGVLFPTRTMMPNSSLAHYLALALENFALDGGRYFIDEDGLQAQALQQMLEQACATNTPYALLGASYSFVHLMDQWAAQGVSVALPAGSRFLDTGGFKGQSRTLALDAFYARIEALFGVPASACINMYGMTELSTQFYDDGNARQPAVKSGPHWIRTRAIDPLTGQDVAPGQPGVLVHCDLANTNSVTTILTQDMGAMVDGGFLLLGRAEGAHARGCSLAIDAFLAAAGA